jgi:hypothetical protein
MWSNNSGVTRGLAGWRGLGCALPIHMKRQLGCLILFILAVGARAEVRISIQDSNGLAYVKYECTAGEIIRAFALDVSVDRGQIVAISSFFRGVSTPGATGYGIFPASLRDNITITSGTNVDWQNANYTPLAVPADNPSGTLPGLNSSGVTLELGALWDPNSPTAIPAASGTLCALKLSQAAQVSISANVSRGGVVNAVAGAPLKTVFTGAAVGPAITSATMANGTMNILFQGGQLQTADTIDGPWVTTADFSGNHVEPLGTNRIKFYRVVASP